MADRYFVAGGGDNNWATIGNWSTTSGGPGGASYPIAGDSVFFDSNSPISCVITSNVTQNCLNLNTTGWTGTLLLGTVSTIASGGNLYVSGNCTLGAMTIVSYIINEPLNNSSAGELRVSGILTSQNTTLDTIRLRLLGTLDVIQNVTASNIDSDHGKRIYATGSITNCPYWRTTAPTTHHISSVADLIAIADTKDGIYLLDNDINLQGTLWVPIGEGEYYQEQYFGDPFTGTFDGQGFKIRNFSVDNSGDDYHGAGLFSVLGTFFSGNSYERPTIQNLTIEDVELTGNYAIGAMAGFINSAVISDCNISSVSIVGIPGSRAIGGLGGDCYGYGNSPTLISNCIADGIVVIQANNDTGGLLGSTTTDSEMSDIVIENCYVTNVSLSGDDDSAYEFGGLVGYCEGQINKCYVIGDISHCTSSVGGLIGYQFAEVSNCYVDVEITTTVDLDADAIGGLIGYCDPPESDFSILNSYARGNVNVAMATSGGIGGFVGQASNSGGQLIIQNCYSVGIVDSIGTAFGGFIGLLSDDPSPGILNCSWYTTSSTDAIGYFDSDSAPVATLSSKSWGTDESNNTNFYSKTHAVYAQ